MAKSIIVTGASSGIGRATAELFLKNGWTVGLMARREALLSEMAAGHSGAVPLPCDVTDETAVERAFDNFSQRAGRVDALFNNAGIFTKQAPIDEISLEDWQNVVDVNLTGMFLCARAAFSRMRRQDPHGRADHQQRFDLGAGAAGRIRGVHNDQTCDHRANQKP